MGKSTLFYKSKLVKLTELHKKVQFSLEEKQILFIYEVKELSNLKSDLHLLYVFGFAFWSIWLHLM